jgi:hypothetical protein
VWVERTLHFLRAGGDTAHDAACRRSPDTVLSAALALSREEPPHRRWELEARLLTQEPVDAVARRCGLAPGVAHAYAALLFDVRPHLDACDWVALRVIGPGLWRGFKEEELGQVWKLFAYRGGAVALDLVLAITQGRPLPTWARGRPGDGYGEARLRLLVQLLLGALRAGSDEEMKGLVATSCGCRASCSTWPPRAGPGAQAARALCRVPPRRNRLRGSSVPAFRP